MRVKLYDEALQDCEMAIEKKDGPYSKAEVRKAMCLLELERYEEAIRAYEAALETEPDSQDIKVGLKKAKLELKKSKRKDLYSTRTKPLPFPRPAFLPPLPPLSILSWSSWQTYLFAATFSD